MLPSVHALLSGIVDYAGLFPPAQLPMEQAIRNYVRYCSESESWMLGRFICPAARLAELSKFKEVFASKESPLIISTLGSAGKNAQDFLEGLKKDLSDISAFRQRHRQQVDVDVYETKLPAELFSSDQHNSGLASLFGQVTQIIKEQGSPKLTPFYETGLVGEEWLIPVEMTLAATNANADSDKQQRCQAGFKLRCGGVDASAFPLPAQVLAVITSCRHANVPLKFTAGLHHPIRHFDAPLQTKMHGFLNLFVAAVLGSQIEPAQMLEIIEDEDANNFVFNQDGLGWKDFRLPVANVEKAKREIVISFGSCSFEEPCADLRQLGLI